MKNAEAAISSRRGVVKSFRTGGGGLKHFRTVGGGGGVLIWGNATFAGGGSVPHYMPCLQYRFLNNFSGNPC